MLIKKPADIPSSEITDEKVYVNRRKFMTAAGGLGLAAAAGLILPRALRGPAGGDGDELVTTESGGALAAQGREELTPENKVTTYNNYYEFGTDKSDPAENSGEFHPKPWTVAVDGLVKKPASYQLEDFIKPSKLEERIYRMRCVEGWSMVIPWMGFPLADVLRRAEPLPSAKYVEMFTVLRPQEMPGQRREILDWPYKEGLRLDEAMHPLTILATGLYGKPLPNQNGAPLRLVVPWKYGFKGIKSIVRIRLVATQPNTAWVDANGEEYGFYANVNPEVDHPRWSQAKERRIGELRKRDTLMFNGYAEQVASMYSGMDLRKFY